jgi:glycosyltransferase involved in cell wall biosynthesis
LRIVVANKFWYRRGGLERVMFDEIAWLGKSGHEIAHFSTTHPKNDPSPWAHYFVPYLELGREGGLSPKEQATAAVRLFYNSEAARRFSRLVHDFRPDIVHVHGIHRQISPSILDVARRAGIPVVQSLHDYHQICPADVLLYGGSEVCEPRRCRTLWYGPCVSGRCVRGSLSASVLSACETAYAHARRAYERSVRRFISPSGFLQEQMRRAGCRTPVDVVPNAVPVETRREGPGHGFAVIGRLAREKGVEVALRAADLAGVEITIAGDGPLRQRLQDEYPDARFTGYLNGAQIEDLVRNTRAVVVPSVCFENAPMSVLEPMAAGVPVIASRIGGIPEQITDGVDGLLVQPADPDALSKAMRRFSDDPEFARVLGARARETVAERFSAAAHVAGIERTYSAALRDSRDR